MRYLTFSETEQDSYETCFLVPDLSQSEIQRHYIDKFLAGQEEKLLAYDLYKEGKKTSVKVMREYLEDLLPILQSLSVKYLVVGDADYFKTLTKVSKADSALGYVKDSVAGDFKVIYVPNFRQHFYDPQKVDEKIRMGMQALLNHQQDAYTDPGMGIIKHAAYPKTYFEIKIWLDKLLAMDRDLSMDIESFSLKFYEAGIGTISFAWNQHEGVAFPVDYEPIEGATSAPYGRIKYNGPVRALLKDFFRKYLRRAIWHNISYDVTVLIYQLFMEDFLDQEGLLEGLEVMLRNWHDTKLITYLATNSCAGNKLGLKDQSVEFAGDYGQDEIKNILNIPMDQLLEYNLVDTLATWYVLEKHWDTMVADEQLPVYENLFHPAIPDIIHMQLTGLPLDMDRTIEVDRVMQNISDDAVKRMHQLPLMERFIYDMTVTAWEKDYASRKGKAKNPDKIKKKDFDTFPVSPFNPNSPNQLQTLLYGEGYLDLPVLDYTDTKQPATGGETLEKLLNHTDDEDTLAFLTALIEYKAVDKVITAFLPHFLAAPEAKDGWHYLFGNFNLGGTVSGRLSSSGPNLQNLPANVFVAISEALLQRFSDLLGPFVKKGKLALGKLIKSCFKAPPGWLFVGLDYASLEDRISALTTKDPNKLKVYTDGYDGHSLRAYSYFSDQMSDIDPDSVESINSIADKYPELRSKSKAPTFALTYAGTYSTLMNNCGFSEKVAKTIEKKYHELYVVSDQWVSDRLDEASEVGYVTVAFGLRVRTPKLHQVIRGNSKTPHEAEAEGRTAGNALGQSYGLLNTRAGIEFNQKARASEYRLDIRPCAHIHDAQYFLIRDQLEVVQYVNHHLVKAVQWQELPAIQHDEVKLGGELSIFYPDWSVEMEIPNFASEEKIGEIAQKHYTKYCAAA